MSGPGDSTGDVASNWDQARSLSQEPLIVIDPLEEFLDAAGLGSGPARVTPIGGGHSNVTYAIDRGDDRFVLRRPPRGPLPASAHDVLREARLLMALEGSAVRTPQVLATCESSDVIGAPFYVMAFIEGHVMGGLPPELDGPDVGNRIADQLVDALVELHSVDVTSGEVASFGRPGGYLERQLRRFGDLLERNATRPIPALTQIGEWLAEHIPASTEATLVHGDYRLGNVMLAPTPPLRIIALLDWEMATIGDPLADLGYLTATWAEPGEHADPMLRLSQVTMRSDFPDRTGLAARYAARTGRDISDLTWYQALALWKAAIFLEGSYGRYLAGTTKDAYFADLETGVLQLAQRASRLCGLDE